MTTKIKRKIGNRTVEMVPGPDIDLDTEEVYLSDGTRLTEKLAEQMGKEMAAEVRSRRGRPSVSKGQAVRTPNLTVRVPSDLREVLERIAKARGCRVADVSRAALREYAERHKETV